MRTTVDIPDTIVQRAKAAATERGITLSEFVTEALKEKLDRDARAASKP